MEGAITVFLAFAIYLLPSYVGRNTKHFTGIAFLNIFLGWTGIVWVACFIWAFAAPRE